MLPNVVLSAYGDRTEMAHSIEGRVPFLDHRLFEVARRSPVEHNIANGTGKRVVRELARDLVPAEVGAREKWRFSTPRPCTKRGRSAALDRILETYLSREAIGGSGLFDWKRVQALRCARFPPTVRSP